jgi:octaprenyl-diphosphate synthase
VKIKLSDITSIIEPELIAFDAKFKAALKSDVKILDYVIKYLLRKKGKRIRPTIVFLSANAAGGMTEKSYVAAMMIELLHTATLVHDDVVDEAPQRRGLPSINYIWKNKIGVLVGDYLLAQGLSISMEHERYDFLKIITATVQKMSEGELLQIRKTRKLNNDVETYLKIIGAKTASLLEACSHLGALSATESAEHIEALKNYGYYLGLAFQIQDDILDFVGKAGFGKELGGDIREKKITLPLIYALENGGKKEREKILNLMRKQKELGFVEYVIDFVKNNGGIEKAKEKEIEFAEKAKNELSKIPQNRYTTALENLLDFVITREK